MDPVNVTATIVADEYETDLDHLPSQRAYRQAQYDKAYALAQRGATIYIAINGCWSATIDTPGCHTSISAYERLGYHTATADLIRGWLAGGATIMDCRPVYGVTTAHTCQACGKTYHTGGHDEATCAHETDAACSRYAS